MASTRENMSMDTELAFKEFSKNISYCIFNRIIGIIRLLLIIASSICLLLCYCLLTASKYLEYMMIDICYDMDIIYFQKVANDTIQSVLDTVNNWVVCSRDSGSKTNIKREFDSMIERQLTPEWANENNDDLSNETSSTSSDSSVKISESSNSNSDDDESGDDESGDEEVKNINKNLKHEFDSEVEDITQQITHENERNESDLKLVNEIEDVTQQVLAEREENKVVVDLTSEEEEISTETEEKNEEDESEEDESDSNNIVSDGEED